MTRPANCWCGNPARGQVDAYQVNGTTVPAHDCLQCAEHCAIQDYYLTPPPARQR